MSSRYVIFVTLTTALLGTYLYYIRSDTGTNVEKEIKLETISEIESGEDAHAVADEATVKDAHEATVEDAHEGVDEATVVNAIVDKLLDDTLDVSERNLFLLQKKVELNELLEKINMVQTAIKQIIT